MFGLNLFYIEERMLEELLRHVYRCISFQFEDGMRLREFDSVEEAFTEKILNDIILQKQADAAKTIIRTASEMAKPGTSDGKEDNIFQGLMMNMAAEDQFAEKQKRLDKKH